MERRLVGIHAANVMGYSRLTERNEEGSTATLRMYRAVVEESVAAYKGHIFGLRRRRGPSTLLRGAFSSRKAGGQ